MRTLLLLCGLLFSITLWATIDTLQFDSVAQEEQYRDLTASLRCPKCQNNSIADSNAMIVASPSFCQRYLRVGTDDERLLFSVKPVPQSPDLFSGRRDKEEQAS